MAPVPAARSRERPDGRALNIRLGNGQWRSPARKYYTVPVLDRYYSTEVQRKGTRMRTYLGFVLLLTLLAGFGCQPANQQPDPEAKAAALAADRAAIDKFRDGYQAAFSSNDASAAGAYFIESAVSMPPNKEALVGRQAITDDMVAMFEGMSAELTISSEEVEVAGDWAFDRGTFTMKMTPKGDGEPMEDKGKYIVILQRQMDGSWKLAREIWNSDNPLPGSAE